MKKRIYRNRWVRLTVVLFVAAFGLTSCGGGSGESAGGTLPPDEQEVVVAWTGDINSMDPPNSSVEWNRELVFATYETLVNYSYEEAEHGSLTWDGLEVSPGLASSWDVDGATVTFELEEDAVFYPSGNPVTSEDVYWTFDRALEHPAGFGLFNFNLAGIFSADQIEIIDDKTFSITFQNSNGEPQLLTASIPSLRFPHFSIIDSHEADEHATEEDPWAVEWLSENIAGSGPYYIESRAPNEQVEFESVPDYYRGEPDISRIVASISADADLVALMRSGDVDLARAGLTDTQLDDLERNGFSVITQPVPNIVRMNLAMDDERLQDPLVREAIARAIPYDQINNIVYSGRGERAESIVNPMAPGYTEAWGEYDLDLSAAQKLLHEAGVSELSLPLYYDNGIAGFEDIALLLQESFAEIGITLEPISQPTAQYADEKVARVQGEDSQQTGLSLTQGTIWLDDPDPTIDSGWKSTGGSNWARYDNSEVDLLHGENRFNQDPDERSEAYEEIQDILAKELPVIPIVVTGRSVALAPGLEGFTFTPDIMTRYQHLHWAE